MSQLAENMMRDRLKRERVTRDKEYEMIFKRAGDVWALSHDAMKLFIQIFSAIVGGSIYLAKSNEGSINFVVASDVLVLMLVALCITMLWDNKGTWWQWRLRLDAITKEGTAVKIPAPSGTLKLLVQQNGMEFVSSVEMFAASMLYCFFNPLKVTAQCHLACPYCIGQLWHWVLCNLY